MNLGIYLEKIDNNTEFDIAYKLSTYSIQKNIFQDVSVFYNDIGPAPKSLPRLRACLIPENNRDEIESS